MADGGSSVASESTGPASKENVCVWKVCGGCVEGVGGYRRLLGVDVFPILTLFELLVSNRMVIFDVHLRHPPLTSP